MCAHQSWGVCGLAAAACNCPGATMCARCAHQLPKPPLSRCCATTVAPSCSGARNVRTFTSGYMPRHCCATTDISPHLRCDQHIATSPELDNLPKGHGNAFPALAIAIDNGGWLAVPPADVQQIEDTGAVSLLVAGELNVFVRLNPAMLLLLVTDGCRRPFVCRHECDFSFADLLYDDACCASPASVQQFV